MKIAISMSKLAPIILFTYKRLGTLKKTINSLQENYLAKDSELFIFSDAPKSEIDFQKVALVREYLKTIDGFKKITVYESDINKGLAKSIIEGVSRIINIYNKVIVVEDDLSTTPNFLSYMNCCLNYYQTNKKVFSVSGYSFNLGVNNYYKYDSYFLNRGWSWGWATWSDRWEKVDWLINDYAKFVLDRNAQKEFAKGGSDLNAMLRKQMTGNLDSWAIRWFYTQFKIKGLTVYPIYSKVFNNGFDNEATHTTGLSNRYIPILDPLNNTNFILPDTIEISKYYQKKFQIKMGVFSRIISKSENLISLFLNSF